MVFSPFVYRKQDGSIVDVKVIAATESDLLKTSQHPRWQTDWNSTYLSNPDYLKYALKTFDGELIALGAYLPIEAGAVYVYIIYLESAPDSNPTITAKSERKYVGIGEVMLAFAIKLSIDYGGGGDVLLDAKTEELKEHYLHDIGAIPVGVSQSGAQRFLICDNHAANLFTKYLREESE